MNASNKSGFTLIELSIVLVIIGLLVGGVLVGQQDLIKAAETRSVVSSVGKYDTAANTFRLKYNCLPGDCKNAADFGLRARSGNLSCGDGNKIIGSLFTSDAGVSLQFNDNIAYGSCYSNSGDESQLFWADLADAELIEHSVGAGDTSILVVSSLLPKILQDTYIIAANGDMNFGNGVPLFGYTLYGFPANSNQFVARTLSNDFASLSPTEAFQIDSKMDDGDPLSGTVYTLNTLPRFGTSPNKGALANCSTDEGGGVGSYDVDTNIDNSCVIKIRSSAL